MFFGRNSSFDAKDIPDLTGKIAIVTGGNAGIGYETILHLALHHAKVYLAGRSDQRAKAAISQIKSFDATAQVEFLSLDLEHLESVRAAAETFLEMEDKLDILICNAGIIARDHELTSDGIEKDFHVNHLGHFYLSRLLLDAMTRSTDARLGFVASDAYYDYVGKDTQFKSLDDVNAKKWVLKRYGQSKLAMILYSQELASRLHGNPIFVNSLHPGDVDTELVRTVFSWVSVVATWWYDLVKPLTRYTPYQGALTSLYVATSPDIREQNLRGRFFIPIAKLSQAKGLAKDIERQKDVWELSERLLQERGFEIPQLP